jgi:hypothetical protein
MGENNRNVHLSIYLDFRYEDIATGKSLTEDVKGVRTALYMLKKKLVKALYDVDIIEVRR